MYGEANLSHRVLCLCFGEFAGDVQEQNAMTRC